MTDVDGALEELRRAGLHRELRVIESAPGAARRARRARRAAAVLERLPRPRRAIPRVRDAAAEAAERWGAGAGASRLVSGNMTPHRELEAELAAFKGTEACAAVRLGLPGEHRRRRGAGRPGRGRALRRAQPRLDRRRLPARAARRRSSTARRPRRARRRRSRAPAPPGDDRHRPVFSMDGDVAPLAGHRRARPAPRRARGRRRGARDRRRRARRAAALVAELGLQAEVDVIVGTLGKALGSYGAFACCERASCAAFLVNRARTLIFSTALPPPSVGAALRGAADPARRARAWSTGCTPTRAALRAELAAQGFAVAPGDMPIVPLVVGDAATTRWRCCERGARRRRVRAGDPPADGARRDVAPAARGDGRATPRPSCATPRGCSARSRATRGPRLPWRGCRRATRSTTRRTGSARSSRARVPTSCARRTRASGATAGPSASPAARSRPSTRTASTSSSASRATSSIHSHLRMTGSWGTLRAGPALAHARRGARGSSCPPATARSCSSTARCSS